MSITTEYRPVDDATLAGILIGGIHEQEEPARIIRLAMDLATELQSAREEHDHLIAEMERMRGVVTEAVEAMQALITHPLLLGDRMELAMRHDTPPKWEIMPVESQALFDATRALVALTTDGGA